MIGEEPIWVTAEETKTDPVKFKEGVDETIQFQLGFRAVQLLLVYRHIL